MPTTDVIDRADGRGAAATRILDAAERLVQQRGFNAVSYADVADQLRVTKPSLHYHFASKADLGQALVERYTVRFVTELHRLTAAGTDCLGTLSGYVGLYRRTLEQHRMCLCGILAAEYETLPAAMRKAVFGFFEANESWLADVLERGRAAGEVYFTGAALDQARLVIGCLEGGMLVSRAMGDPGRLQVAADSLLATLTPAAVTAALRSASGSRRGAAPR